MSYIPSYAIINGKDDIETKWGNYLFQLRNIGIKIPESFSWHATDSGHIVIDWDNIDVPFDVSRDNEKYSAIVDVRFNESYVNVINFIANTFNDYHHA